MKRSDINLAADIAAIDTLTGDELVVEVRAVEAAIKDGTALEGDDIYLAALKARHCPHES